jgi:hypothetical protein
MKYLCLICAEKLMERMTEADAKRHLQDYAVFIQDIKRSGHFIDCSRLQAPATATTIRVRKGTLSTTDGPWVETKEQLGGYCVIQARDINEAMQVAAKIPGAWIGSVEIRPIAEDEPTLRALGLTKEQR